MTEQQQQVSPGYGKTVNRPFDETLQQVGLEQVYVEVSRVQEGASGV